MRENAWNTAISSVHGERRSSSSSARPAASSFAPLVSSTCCAVALGLGVRVDAAHGQVVASAPQCFGQVRRRVGGRQVHGQAALRPAPPPPPRRAWSCRRRPCPSASPGHGRRRRCHRPAPPGRARRARSARRHGRALRVGSAASSSRRSASSPTRLKGLSDTWSTRQGAAARRASPPTPPARARRSPRPAGRCAASRCGQHAVDDQILLRQADGRELVVRARRLAQGGLLGARHQHQARALRVGQGIDRVLVLRALLLQPGQRAQARRVALAGLEEAAPGAGQLQQADGVAGGCGVEDDVIVVGRSAPGRSAVR